MREITVENNTHGYRLVHFYWAVKADRSLVSTIISVMIEILAVNEKLYSRMKLSFLACTSKEDNIYEREVHCQ